MSGVDANKVKCTGCGVTFMVEQMVYKAIQRLKSISYTWLIVSSNVYTYTVIIVIVSDWKFFSIIFYFSVYYKFTNCVMIEIMCRNIGYTY